MVVGEGGTQQRKRVDIPAVLNWEKQRLLARVIQRVGECCVDVVSSGRPAGIVSCCRVVSGRALNAKIRVGSSGSFCFQTEDSVAFMRDGAT